MFSWFPLIVGTDKDGKEIRHPAYQGTERLSNDGTMFLMHDEIATARGCELAEEEIISEESNFSNNDNLKNTTIEMGKTTNVKKTFTASSTIENPMKAIMTKGLEGTKLLMESAEWMVESLEIVTEIKLT